MRALRRCLSSTAASPPAGAGGAKKAVTFASLGVHSDVHSVLARAGIHRPSPVQAEVIPRMLDSRNPRDVLMFSETGKCLTLSHAHHPSMRAVHRAMQCGARAVVACQ
jgi:superfamily II DNA/RNA helicase